MSSTPPAPLNYKSSDVYPPGSYMDEVVNKALREHRRKLNENQLSPEEQKIVDDVLNAGMLQEGEFDPKKILNKLIQWGKKGVLTAAILSSVLTSCNFDNYIDKQIERDLKHNLEQWKNAEEDAESRSQRDSSSFKYTDSYKPGDQFNMDSARADNFIKARQYQDSMTKVFDASH
jgi:hypothetical protein